jgi:uncharacterized membrane protein
MRSAVLAGLVLLGGCDGELSPKQKAISSHTDAGVAGGRSENGPVEVVYTVESTEPTGLDNPKVRVHAFGNEPFWSVQVMPGILRYSSPETEDIDFVSLEVTEGKGSRYSGVMNGENVILQISPGKCSDGMSDTVHSWTAMLTIGAKSHQGCARVR